MEPLYRKALGAKYGMMPQSWQALHDISAPSVWRGTAQITRGVNPLARFVAFVFGFPPAGDNIPVSVTFTPVKDGELWERDFGGKKLRSFQSLGQGAEAGFLEERFGAISVALELNVENARMYLIPRRWRLGLLPLPRMFLPRGDSFEEDRNGDFAFDVTVAGPIVGVIVKYRGRLTVGELVSAK